ncbi:MAG: DUF460 domain-containing protein [Candidatus Undinarchaeales archaeon]|jgi:predicted RNase H-like nuclease (RuvC/YqgF family)|nr:DUF460 domain-containing protein [Candidatus Undinarchaeales archaeon]MDP7494135.1 DUF460 domain-containing protein [Candidatus Undinarchaeales archaeon]
MPSVHSGVGGDYIKGLIVGIDPGTTTGVAMLDLDGNVVHVESRREYPRADIVYTLISHGRPAVVATDVNPTPSAVERIAHTFGATIYRPHHVLAVEEKTRLVRDIPGVTDSHRRDALACAIKAYDDVRQNLDRVDRKARDAELDDVLREEVRVRVLRGDSPSIDAAIREVSVEVHEEAKVEAGAPAEPHVHRSRALRREVVLLREYKDHLEVRVESLEHRVMGLLGKLDRVRKGGEREAFASKAVRTLDGRIKNLASRLEHQRKENNELKRANRRLEVRARMALEGLVPVERPTACKDGDVVVVTRPSQARHLHCRPLLVLSTFPDPPIPTGVPWIRRKALKVTQNGGEWFVSRQAAEQAAYKRERSKLIDVVDEYKHRDDDE